MSDAPPIHEALLAVMRDVQAIAKADSGQGVSYSFRGIDRVMNAVGPALREHGVLAIPEHMSSTRRDFTTRNGALMHEVVVRVAYHFIGPAGDKLTAIVEGESADASDKATSQAFSVTYRTCLLQALTIPTNEPEPDARTFDRAGEFEPPEPPEPRLSDEQVAELDALAEVLSEGHPKRERWNDVRLKTVASGYASVKAGLIAAATEDE